jgi:hypothetical protein
MPRLSVCDRLLPVLNLLKPLTATCGSLVFHFHQLTNASVRRCFKLKTAAFAAGVCGLAKTVNKLLFLSVFVLFFAAHLGALLLFIGQTRKKFNNSKKL